MGKQKPYWRPLNEKYTFKCVSCGKKRIVTAIDILKYLKNSKKFYCLNCIDEKKDYKICEECKSKNPLGSLECMYCGHIEIML